MSIQKSSKKLASQLELQFQKLERGLSRKARLAEKLMELGNLVLSGLVLAQVFREKFHLKLALFGFLITAATYIVAYFIV